TANQKLREALERRQQQRSTAGLQRIPFMLDEELADRIEGMGRRAAAIEDRLQALGDAGEGESEDRRASDPDERETLTAELGHIKADLETAIEEARDCQVDLVFRRLNADEYEHILIRSGGAEVDTDAASAQKFHSEVTARCFLRVELDGEDTGQTWTEFLDAAQPTFGELDPIRALVYANNRRGSNTVNF
ncbi:hypothetical protein ACTQ4Z_10100, partial [Anaerovoracaceae bacterium Sow4_D4]